MALLASLAIAVGYLATEGERLAVRGAAANVADMFELTVGLSNSVRDQEAGVDDYLLSRSPDAAARYRSAVEDELSLAAQIQIDASADPTIQAALDTTLLAAQTWRTSFAEPAIVAVERGSATDIGTISAASATDQSATLAGIDALTARIHDAETAVAVRDDAVTETRTAAALVGILLMLLAAGTSLILARRWINRPLGRLLATAREVELGTNVAFKTERNDEIGRLGSALERMRAALQQDVDQSGVLNRFTEVTTFAPDDTAVASVSLEAFMLLVHPDAAVAHVLNPSKDRAIPEAKLGAAIAEVLPLNALSSCPAIVRGSIYVTTNAAEALSVHCPIYPIDHGTLACVPLAHGDTVGAVHLFWEEPDSFGLEMRSAVARVAEHAALAIANRRLLAALQGMANTDARTGLANTRAFDQTLEDALLARRTDESVAVLMLDLDRFKDFNDRHGHPSGDVALRTFADVLRTCLRDGDVAARYGGEEFAVVLVGANESTALAVAERIRNRTELTVISLGPGVTDRISVSIGIASAPQQALDRISLMRLADEALYRAKQAGRNRVMSAAGPAEPAAELMPA